MLEVRLLDETRNAFHELARRTAKRSSKRLRPFGSFRTYIPLGSRSLFAAAVNSSFGSDGPSFTALSRMSSGSARFTPPAVTRSNSAAGSGRLFKGPRRHHGHSLKRTQYIS
jgi:hypothetical protein